MSSHEGGSSAAAASGRDGATIATESGRLEERRGGSGDGVCGWRTEELSEGECERFFDCPSHQVPRGTPVEDGQATNEAVETHDDTSDAVQNTTAEAMEEHNNTLETDDDGPEDVTGDDTTNAPIATASSTLAPTAIPPAIFPERSSSHMEPLVHPRSLDDSLPPTPRDEETGELQFPPTSSSSRRRSTTTSTTQDSGSDTSAGQSSSRSQRSLAERQRQPLPPPPSSERSLPSRPLPPVPPPEAATPSSEAVLPRWQPDAEVTYCPICKTQFSIFVRKHHCRKCGRVVCNSCSPHRIIIPHQYIVRPPGSDATAAASQMLDPLSGGYFDGYGLSGGERVRLCNPCVPDPQTAPPQSPGASLSPGPAARLAHHRSRSTMVGLFGSSVSSGRHGNSYADGRRADEWRYGSGRTRSITMAPGAHAAGSSSSRTGGSHSGSLSRLPGSSFPSRYMSLNAAASSRQRALPPTPQIAEEDECPICHRELPSRDLEDFETAREAHINACILSHSTYGSPRAPPPPTGGQSGEAGSSDGQHPLPPLPAAPAATPLPMRRTGMYKYVATEKDCIDDAECTICLEEFAVGVGMARLECLCRFHRACISAWFVNHPGRCPVHQHDGFGF